MDAPLVVREIEEGWEIRSPAKEGVILGRADTMNEAVARARALLDKHGRGQILVISLEGWEQLLVVEPETDTAKAQASES
jgi:hypothetical protein